MSAGGRRPSSRPRGRRGRGVAPVPVEVARPLAGRCSRPAHSPDRVPPDVQDRIERLRRERKLGPARIAAELRADGVSVSASGVHRVLVRLGLNRLRDLDRPTGEQLRRPNRY